MLLGLPCAAASVGGVPSMLSSREGLLLDPAQPGAIEQAICALWEQPERADQLSCAAHERAMTTHDPAAIARCQLKIYEQLLGRPLATPDSL